MSTSAFRQGAVVEIEGRTYQLLRKIESDIWQAEESRTKRIEEFAEQQLRSFYVEGKLKFGARQSQSRDVPKRRPLVDYSPEQWEQAKIRRAYAIAILDLPSSRSRLIPVIRDTWLKLQRPEKAPNVSTVIRWKNKLLRAGKDVTALIEQNEKKGNTMSRHPVEVEQIVRQAIDTKYLTEERGTIQDTVDKAKAEVLRENALRPDAIRLPSPTRRLVWRMISAIPAFDRYAARHGRTGAVKRFRSVQAHRTTAAPLERAEMDHTLLDLMAIDDRTALPLGRPWLTACLDDNTRNALGIHVSFEPPSYFTVARCLKHAFLPKVNIRKEYPAIVNNWEAHGVMRELVVDNGREFHSDSLENACYSLGIELHYSARKTAWFKGKIERLFGTLNGGIAHGNPGTTFRNIFEKEEYDPSKHAVIRYSVLKEIICTWICDVYHQKPHRTLRVPPAIMWAQSITSEEILLLDDPERLDAILGRREVRRLTHKGIELDGLFYNSHDLTGLRRKHGDKLDVEVRVDDADIGKIIVLSPDQRQTFSVPALNAEYAAGLSGWQHRVCKRYAAQELSRYSPAGWLEAKARIAELIDAEFMHKKQRTRTKVARYKGDVGVLNSHKSADPARDSRQGPPIETTSETSPTPVDSTQPEGSPALAAPRKRFKPIYRERTTDAVRIGEEQ